MFNLRRTPFSSMTGRERWLVTAITRHHVEHTVRDGLDFGSRANRLIGSQATLGVDQVRCKDGVDQSGLSETGLTYSGRAIRVSVRSSKARKPKLD